MNNGKHDIPYVKSPVTPEPNSIKLRRKSALS